MEKKDGKAIDKEIAKESDDSFEAMDSKMKDAADVRKRLNEISGQHSLPEMGSISMKKMKQTDDDDDLNEKLKAGADSPVFDVGSEDDHVKMGSTDEINQSGQSSDVVAHDIEKGKDAVVSGGDSADSETETDTEFDELEDCFHEMCSKLNEVIEIRKKVDEASTRFINSILGGGSSQYGDVDTGDNVKIDQPGESSIVRTGSEGNGDKDVPVSGRDSGEGKQESQELNKQGDVKNDLGKIADDLENDV